MTLFWRNYLTHFPEAAAAPGSLKISRVTVTDSSAGKESACKAGDLGSIPGLEDPLRRERLPTPVFCPGEFSPWGCKELDTTE